MHLPDLVVAGGGIAGLTAALASANRGLRVTIIDSPRLGAASRASAGMLAPSVDGLPADVLPAALAARDTFPGFLDALRERAGIDVHLDRRGILELADSEDELDRMARRAGPEARRLDEAALAVLEPALAPHPGAILHPHDGAVDVVTLMRALDLAVGRAPGITRIAAAVTAIDVEGDSPAFRAEDGARYRGKRLLLANGAWAGTLAGLPRPLAVRPERGQLMRVQGVPVRHVVYGADGYLIPRGPALLVGATREETGFTCGTTPEGLRELRAIAARAVPVLAHAAVLEHWAGLRPISADGLPLLGPDPDLPALTYACGYSRNGILFAPWAAERLAAHLAGTPLSADLTPFRVDRPSLATP